MALSPTSSTASPPALSAPVQEAFEAAKREFYQNLKNPANYNLSKFTSINDVYDTTQKIQEEQSRTGSMRHLNRIKPYLDGLTQFVGVLDTFSQVKADISSLVWAPIKLLLQISSTVVKSYDKILSVMGQIGDRLPNFMRYSKLFKSNDRVQHLLCFFFKDILDFHVTALNFFNLKKWSLFFESLWPKYGNRITIIMANVERHSSLMIGEVTLMDIANAQEAREQAAAKYARDEEFQRCQDFAFAKQALSPSLYDDELEAIRKIRCRHSGAWLERHDKFRAWLDPKGQSRFFWLNGIPGAGKTVLSSCIIDKVRNFNLHNSLFAFLSYKDPNISLVKIYHSFIFQLLLETPHLQPVITAEYRDNSRRILSDTGHVRSLLLNLLQAVEVTYIILDGLDEINQIERQFVLKELLEINRDSAKTRLLLSSRIEPDIVRLLPTNVEEERVDYRNIDDIQDYVQIRTNEWLMSSPFDIETCGEIRKLIVPLPKKSGGMILYAKLVIESLSFLGSVVDVVEELNVLPDGLDQAYGRILERINNKLTGKQRELTKRVLGWIGCSQIPLRKRELESALSIRDGDLSFFKRQRVFLDLPGLCGPIIEVHDEVVQFVHFTAQKYIVGSERSKFINSLDANLDIAKTCVRYLAFRCLQVLDPSEIQASIVAGDFTLFNYAATQWIDQFLQCTQTVENLKEIKDVCDAVEDLVQKWENVNYDGTSHGPKRKETEFKALQEQSPETYEILISERWFWRLKAPFEKLDDVATLNCTKSPLSIFSTYADIHCQLQSLLCQSSHSKTGCRCKELETSYGPRLFKCDRLGCRFHNLGFETRKERNTHVEAHDRRFKCPKPDCQFSDLGFISKAALGQHMDQCHREEIFVPRSPTPVVLDMEHQNLDTLFFDSVSAGDIDNVRRLLGIVSDEVSNQGYIVALRYSTTAMVKLFLDFGKDIDTSPDPSSTKNIPKCQIPLAEAIDGQNYEVANYLLSHGCNVNKRHDSFPFHTALDAAILLESYKNKLEAVALLLDYGVDLSKRSYTMSDLIPDHNDDNLKVIQLLEIFKVALWPENDDQFDQFTTTLIAVAGLNRSIEVAEYLLKNGANIDGHFRSKDDLASPLYVAARGKTRSASKFMKFLLESGADPFRTVNGKLPGDRRGAKNISKWLGMTWDELVESTKGARAK